MDAKYRELEVENERLRARIAKLEATVETLIAALEKAQRSGKRQAAPFRKGESPQPQTKKPG